MHYHRFTLQVNYEIKPGLCNPWLDLDPGTGSCRKPWKSRFLFKMKMWKQCNVVEKFGKWMMIFLETFWWKKIGSMWKRNKVSLWWIVTEIDTFLLNTCPGVLHSSCSERHAHLKEKASKISKFSRKLGVATKAGGSFQAFKIVRICNQGRGKY